MSDITSSEYKKALRKFEQICQAATEDQSLVFCEKDNEWKVMPHKEAVEAEVMIVLTCFCLKDGKYARKD